jgi:hypothetical protein
MFLTLRFSLQKPGTNRIAWHPEIQTASENDTTPRERNHQFVLIASAPVQNYNFIPSTHMEPFQFFKSSFILSTPENANVYKRIGKNQTEQQNPKSLAKN